MEGLNDELLGIVKRISANEVECFYLHSRFEDGQYKWCFYFKEESLKYIKTDMNVQGVALKNNLKMLVEKYFQIYNNVIDNQIDGCAVCYHEINITVKKKKVSVIPNEKYSSNYDFRQMKMIWDSIYLKELPRKKQDVDIVLKYWNEELFHGEQKNAQGENLIYIQDGTSIVAYTAEEIESKKIRRKTVGIPNKNNGYIVLKYIGRIAIGVGIKIYFMDSPPIGLCLFILGVAIRIGANIYLGGSVRRG